MRAYVGAFEIPARDPARIASFFHAVFGWQCREIAWDGPRYFAFQPQGEHGVRGGVLASEVNAGNDLQTQQPLLMLHVEDAALEECLAKIVEHGGTVDLPPRAVGTMGETARFRDPEENLFGLWRGFKAAGR